MTVAQYAKKNRIKVKELLSLCKMLGIKVDSADDILSDYDILLLDETIKEMLEDNNLGGGGGNGGYSGTGSGERNYQKDINENDVLSPPLEINDDTISSSDSINYDSSSIKNAIRCLKNMQAFEENPNFGILGAHTSSGRYQIETYTNEIESRAYTDMATSLLYYTVKNFDEGFDFGLYDDGYSLEEYYEKMITGEFNDANGEFDQIKAQEYLANVNLGTEEENMYYTGEFYSKLINGEFNDANGEYDEAKAQEYLASVSAIIAENNRIREEERNQTYDDVILSVSNNYDRRVDRYNNRVLEKEKEIDDIDNQIAGLQAQIDSAKGINPVWNPFISSSDTIINLRDYANVDEMEKQLTELQQQRINLINESVDLKNQRDEFFLDSLAVRTMSRDFSDLSSTEGFTIDPKYANYYGYLTPEEQKVVIYLQNTGRDGKLGQFFGLKQNYFNQMLAQDEAQAVINNINYLSTQENNSGGRIDNGWEFLDIIAKSMQNAVAGTPGESLSTNDEKVFQYLVGVGFADGLNNFEAGIKNLYSADGIPSVEQYKTGYIVEGLKKAYGSDGIFGGNAFTSIYEISSSIGNMAPAMAISALTTALTKNLTVGAKVGEILGTTTMGLSAAGNVREQGLQQGMTDKQAWNYGLMSGSSEAAIGYLLGGIPFLSRLDDMPGVKGYFCKMLGEGLEEGLQSILDPMFVAVATNNEHKFDFNSVDWNEVWKSGVYGAITAGILNGANILQTATPENIIKHEIGNVGYYLDAKIAEELALKYEGKDYTDPVVLDEFRSDLESAVGLDGNSVVFRVGNVEYAVSGNLANQLFDKYAGIDTTKRSVMNQVVADIENTPGVISTELLDVKNKKGVYYVDDDGEILISSIEEVVEYSDAVGEIVNESNEISIVDNIVDLSYLNFGLFSQMQARLDAMGIDTTDMSFEDMKTKYPDVYDEVLNPVKFEQLELFNQIPTLDEINDIENDMENGIITKAQIRTRLNNLIGDKLSSWILTDNSAYSIYMDLLTACYNANIEVFELKRSINIMESMIEYYDKARNLNVKKGGGIFNTYRTHGIVHIFDVLLQSINTYAVFKSSEIKNLSLDTIMLSAVMHDTGMSGGKQLQFTLDNNGYLVIDTVDIESNGKIYRESHSFNSAVNILNEYKVLRETGYTDVQIVEAALLTFAHSKSNSGLNPLSNNISGWSFAIQALSKATENSEFNLVDILVKEGFLNMNNSSYGGVSVKTVKSDLWPDGKAEGKVVNYCINQKWLDTIAYESLVIRLGDALTNNDNAGINQYGRKITFEHTDYNAKRSIEEVLNEYEVTSLDKQFSDLMKKLEDAAGFEAKNITYEVETENGIENYEAAQQYVLGENNQKYKIVKSENGSIDVVISVKNSERIPFCTLFAINERLGELNSKGNGIFGTTDMQSIKMVIEIDSSTSGDIKDLYYQYAKFNSEPDGNVPIEIREINNANVNEVLNSREFAQVESQQSSQQIEVKNIDDDLAWIEDEDFWLDNV